MPETPQTEETKPAEQSSTEGQAPAGESQESSSTEETTEGKQPEGQEESKTDPLEELPDWAKKEIKSLRGESANYRTRLRDAEQRLEQAKTPEEFEAALTEVKSENAKLEQQILRSNVAREFDLPSDLADLLKGEDEAALKEHAKVLQKYVTKEQPEHLSGGLTPSDEDGGFDPVALAREARTRRY